MPNFRRGPLRPQKFFIPQLPFGNPAPVVITPANAALTLTTFAPTVSTPVVVTPAKASLTLSTFAPSVLTPVKVTPAKLALTLNTFAPTLSISVPPVVITPATVALILTGYPPDVQGDLHQGGYGHVVSDTGRRLRFPLAPEFQPVTVTPPTARLRLTTYQPKVTVAEGPVDITEAYTALYASGALSDEEFVALVA